MAFIQDFLVRIGVKGKQDLDAVNDSLEQTEKNANKAAVANDRLAKSKINAKEKSDKFKDSLTNLTGEFERSIGGSGRLTDGLTKMSGAMSAAGVAAGSVAVGLGAVFVYSVRFADSIMDVSGATGIAAGRLLSFSGSVIQAGGSMEGAEKMAIKLNQALGEAQLGNQAALKSFNDLGVSIINADGSLKTADQTLPEVIEKLKEITDKSLQAALGAAIFGKEWARLEAEIVKADIDPIKDEQLRKLSEYSAKIDNLIFKFKVLGVEISNAMANVIVASSSGKLIEERRKRENEIISLYKERNPSAETKARKDANRARQQNSDLLRGAERGMKEKAAQDEYLAKLSANREKEQKAALIASETNRKKLAAAAKADAEKNRKIREAEDIAQEKIKYIAEMTAVQYKSQEESLKRMEEISSRIKNERQKLLNVEKQILIEQAGMSDADKELAVKNEEFTNELLQKRAEIYAKYAEFEDNIVGLSKEMLDNRQKELDLADKLNERQKTLYLMSRKVAEVADPFDKMTRGAEKDPLSIIIERTQEMTDQLANMTNITESSFYSMFSNMTDALDAFVDNGKFKFKDFAASIIKDLIKIQLRAQMMTIFNQLLGKFTGTSWTESTTGMKILASELPGRATGGPVSANMPYIVGERGPEMFMPKTSGTIVPNHAMGGSTTIINNISALDAKSVAELFAQNRKTLLGTVRMAEKEMPGGRR